jgi:hypothetical protein
MHPGYFETLFRIAPPLPKWPDKFVILSAFATTGERWAEADNALAHRGLGQELMARGVWTREITGYSPITSHSELSWATTVSLEKAREVGRRYHQDAIFRVRGDRLWVTGCGDRARLTPAGRLEVDLEERPSPWAHYGTPAARKLVLQAWGDGTGVFFVEVDWAYMRQVGMALQSASTWGELSLAMPPGEFESLSLWAAIYGTKVYRVDGRILFRDPDDLYWDPKEDDILDASDPFDPRSLWGYGDGDYPPWTTRMFTALPEGFIESFGEPASSMVSGHWHEYPMDRAGQMIDVLESHGFQVRVERGHEWL